MLVRFPGDLAQVQRAAKKTLTVPLTEQIQRQVRFNTLIEIKDTGKIIDWLGNQYM